MISTIENMLTDHTFMVVALGTGLLGLLSGVVGVFMTLRKQSLLGDALGHAALPGIVLMFIFIREKNLALLLFGAIISGMIATAIINAMNRYTSIKLDSALSLVLSTFFGFGTALLTYIQRDPSTAQAGLEKFIFGQASGMLIKDVQMISVLGVVVLILVAIFWKEFKLLSFDRHYARTLSGPYHILDYVLSFLTVLVIGLGLESVGVVLISALLVAPAIAARQWSNRLWIVVMLSGIFGFISGILGTFFSSLGRQIPTGPVIVVIATSIVILSLLFAPKRGLIQQKYQQKQRQLALIDQIESEEIQ